MNVLVIGSGGREHALAWKALSCAGVEKVYVAPGNAGTALELGIENVALEIEDFSGLAQFAEDQSVGLTIVGPEQPLVDGIVDFFQLRQLAIFGPTQGASQLEASKAFSKDFLARHKIPSGDYKTFTDSRAAIAYVRRKGAPIVVKADGLAAGKGVIVATDLDQAEHAIIDMLSENVFGKAGHQVVIEEYLDGEEASFIVMVDGQNVLPMATSQDHKRVGDGDKGPNTGGMGAYSPAPVVSEQVYQRVMNEIIRPTVLGMAKEGNPYTGFLYAGLMIMADGSPKVIEYNCRFGDPETQPILLRLQSDLVAHCLAALSGDLDSQSAKWDARPAVGIVLASAGYPGNYAKGHPVGGLNETGNGVNSTNISKVFHAGTRFDRDQVVTNGGRVLCAAALGDSIAKARDSAYAVCESIDWDGAFYRRDIAWRAIRRDNQEPI